MLIGVKKLARRPPALASSQARSITLFPSPAIASPAFTLFSCQGEQVITIPHMLAARLTGMLREIMPAALQPGGQLPVLLVSGPTGLVFQVQAGSLAIELRHRQSGPEATVCLPAAALAVRPGQKATPLVLQASTPGSELACQQNDGAWPAHSDPLPSRQLTLAFPSSPDRLTPAPRRLGQALLGATQTVACPGSGSVLSRWLLRARQGELISCDGVQLLVQSGLSFPWQEELLVVALPVGAARQLAVGRRIVWGKSAHHLCLRRGPWSYYLACDDPARYPAVMDALASSAGAATRVQLAPADAALLARTLSRLCRPRLHEEPVTLELDEYPVVYCQQPGQKSTCTLALRHSRVSGPPTRLRTACTYLLRAVRLGFRELTVTSPDGPLVCQDGWRSYRWMPLIQVATPPAGPALTESPRTG
jgi:hypothetical protein